jgi:hypothetical protein
MSIYFLFCSVILLTSHIDDTNLRETSDAIHNRKGDFYD